MSINIKKVTTEDLWKLLEKKTGEFQRKIDKLQFDNERLCKLLKQGIRMTIMMYHDVDWDIDKLLKWRIKASRLLKELEK